jgi:hypothetical protein
MIGFMAANFSAFRSLVLSKTVFPPDLQIEGLERKGLQKKIWLKAPGFFRSEAMSTSGDSVFFAKDFEAGMPGHVIYHFLFMARNKNLQKELFRRMAIDLNFVSLERRHEKVVYRIGHPEGNRPVIVLEKDLFLPLEIRFCSEKDRVPVMLSIRFDDYRKLEKGWYPFRVSYFRDGELLGFCTITALEINPPIKTVLSPIPLEDILPETECEGREASPQEERFDSIMKSLQDKYN